MEPAELRSNFNYNIQEMITEPNTHQAHLICTVSQCQYTNIINIDNHHFKLKLSIFSIYNHFWPFNIQISYEYFFSQIFFFKVTALRDTKTFSIFDTE